MFGFKTAFRYAFSRTRGQRTTSIMILLGIAIGLVALLVISAVMNGLQNAQLDQLRNLESFDLIVKSKTLTKEDIEGISQVDNAFRFIETNVLIVDKTSDKSSSSRVRAYDENIFQSGRMTESIYVISGDPEALSGFLISYSMLSKLSMRGSDDIQVTFLKPGKTATIVPSTRTLGVDGYFSSRMTEFSLSTIFMDYVMLSDILENEDSRIGVYVRSGQGKVVKAIMEMDPEADVITWQEYNKALYSALTLEKTLMYVFLAFMFLIICVNLKNSTRRLLRNKQKEGAMLRALGCSRARVNRIFLGQGLVICALGEVLGVITGKLVIYNIGNIFKAVDNVVYALTRSRTVLTQIPFNATIGNWEIAVVCIFVFLLSLLFTLIGCRKIHKSEIMEVILHATY